MSLQDILKKILDDTQGEVKALEKEYAQKQEAIKTKSDEMLAEELSTLKEKSQKANQSVLVKIESMARRENNNHLLATKNKLIEQALTKFLHHLENANDELYGKILKQLFAPLEGNSGRIFVSKKRLAITKKHAPADCTFFEDDSIKGGFLFRGVDKEIDNTFSNLIFAEFSQELSSYLAEQLKLI